jgi:hypothetical protein
LSILGYFVFVRVRIGEVKMTEEEEIIYQYALSYNKITLYKNRVVIHSPGTLGITNEKIIPIRAITDIKISGLSQTLEINTIDGKNHKLVIYGDNSKELRNALLKLL